MFNITQGDLIQWNPFLQQGSDLVPRLPLIVSNQTTASLADVFDMQPERFNEDSDTSAASIINLLSASEATTLPAAPPTSPQT